MKVHFCFCYNVRWWAVLAPVISYFEKLKRVSHFAIVLEHSYGKTVVYESVWPRTQKVMLEDWLDKYEVATLFTFDVPNRKQYEVYDYLEAQVGKWYPFSQLLFILFAIINKTFEKISSRWVLNGHKHLICTELGSRFVEHFFNGIIKESHDRIGLKDMLQISEEYRIIKEIWR
jgi:hypothetical protein